MSVLAIKIMIVCVWLSTALAAREGWKNSKSASTTRKLSDATWGAIGGGASLYYGKFPWLAHCNEYSFCL